MDSIRAKCRVYVKGLAIRLSLPAPGGRHLSGPVRLPRAAEPPPGIRSVVRNFRNQFYPRQPRTFSDSRMFFGLARISSRGASTLIFIRQSPCMFYCMAKLSMSRRSNQRTPFIRAVGGVVLVHPRVRRNSESDRIGTEVDGALQYAWKAHSSSLGTWDRPLLARRSHERKTITGAQLTLAYFQLTYRLKVGFRELLGRN